MQGFILRRLFSSLASLLVVTLLIFMLSRVYGDPVSNFIPEEGYGMSEEELDKIAARLHLDRPIIVQYFYWIGDLATGDLGQDLVDRRPISHKLGAKLGPTLQLAGIAWLLATVVGIPIGVLSAIKRGTVWDLLGRSFAVFGQSLPTFWVAIVAILIFSVWLQWLPAGHIGEGFSVKHHILPTLILSWLPMAGYVRLIRSSMLEVLDSEYIRLARAKGVGSRSIVWKHAFRNALIAPLTFGALLLGGLLGGSIAVETVFAWPGVARWAVEAIWANNVPVLALVTLIFTSAYIALNFIVDILYAVIDPRIRYS